MKSFAKRLCFFFGLVPLIIFCGAYWLFTGKDPMHLVQQFDAWVSK